MRGTIQTAKEEIAVNKKEIGYFLLISTIISTFIWIIYDVHFDLFSIVDFFGNFILGYPSLPPLMILIIILLAMPVIEDYLFRMPLLMAVLWSDDKRHKVWYNVANIVVSFMFATQHPFYTNKFLIFALSLYLGNFVIRTKSWFAAVLMHLSYNLIAFCFLLI